jgi:two-component system chemotaxis response regulator CheB
MNAAVTTRVLVVDDSGFFRRRIVEILEANRSIEVIGTAANGQDALEQVARLNPDVVTMDIEMPVMDGITAVRHIMSSRPTPVLMFSSLTHEGARATLDALDAGAVDFLPKRFEDIAKDRAEASKLLCRRVLEVGRTRSGVVRRPAASPRVQTAVAQPTVVASRRKPFRLVAIATSTGGPVALRQVLTQLPADYPLPVLVVQHMPAGFTPAFAARLDQQCKISVAEAKDGDLLKAGQVLIAPGGRQMTLRQQTGDVRVQVTDNQDQRIHYRPCADITFASVASVYGDRALALVLTGMGADGREGARKLKQQGSVVWSQDEESSVIYGMPAAVAEAGLTDQVLPLREFGPALVQVSGG